MKSDSPKYYQVQAKAWLPWFEIAAEITRDGSNGPVAVFRTLAARAILQSSKPYARKYAALRALDYALPPVIRPDVARQASELAAAYLRRLPAKPRPKKQKTTVKSAQSSARHPVLHSLGEGGSLWPGVPRWIIDRDEMVFAMHTKEKLGFQEIRERLDLHSKEHARTCFHKACRRRRESGRLEGLEEIPAYPFGGIMLMQRMQPDLPMFTDS
jgi:hypothetical protein